MSRTQRGGPVIPCAEIVRLDGEGIQRATWTKTRKLKGASARRSSPLTESFEILPCDPALADTAAFCAHYGIPPGESGNTIVVATKKEPRRHAACLVLATHPARRQSRRAQAPGRPETSFASGEETAALTGMMMGGVTVFGLPPDLPDLHRRRRSECAHHAKSAAA